MDDSTSNFYDDYYSKSQNLYQEELEVKDAALGAAFMILTALSTGALLAIAAKKLIDKTLHK